MLTVLLFVFQVSYNQTDEHNCRLWGIISENAPSAVIQDHLVNLPNSIKNLGNGANPDGWSVGYYADGIDDPTVNRGFPQASSDPNFNVAATEAGAATPRIAVSHIRNTSSGLTPALGDPHPFERVKNGRHWLMAQNGTIDKDVLLDLIRPAYFSANPPQYGSNQSEWIDTDLYQILFLQTLEDFNWQVKEAIGYMINQLRAEIGSSTYPSTPQLNFYLSDGTTLWAYREGNGVHTLYYLYNTTGTPYTAVASQYPSSSQGAWVAMSNGQLITMYQDSPPLVEDIEDYFGGTLIEDNYFDESANSTDLRTNGGGQDWYESRETNPELVSLDETIVGGNGTKKAAFTGSTTDSENVYLTQEFSAVQTGVFGVQWDIFIDEILDISDDDRAGFMLIGDDTDPTRTGPNSDDPERFVYLGFHAEGGASSGLMNLVARDRDDGWSGFTVVEADLNLDQWYTIKVICDLEGGTYDVYVNDVFSATVSSRHEKTSVSHISFAQWDDGAGSFYVDNVMGVSAGPTNTLTISADPSPGGTTNPASGDHEYAEGAVVSISASANSGYEFDHWTGDVVDVNSASTSVTMDDDQVVTAHFNAVSVTFLEDNDFNASGSDSDLRTNGAGQDWYESRETDPGLLTLNETSVGGNTTKKAAFAASTSGNAYLSQEFGAAQTGIFGVQWDIYMDEILDISAADRSGFVLVGDDTDATRTGPNSDDPERFVYLAFHAEGGASSGLMNLVARDRDDSWSDFTIVESGLSLDQWYTIKVICDLAGGTYDVYVDDVFSATVSSRHEKTSVSHISFAQWNDGAGSFYVDNVMEAFTGPTYTLTMSADPSSGGTTNPSSGDHEYAEGAVASISASANSGYEFDHWTGDVADPGSASTTVTMDEDQVVTAHYNSVPVVFLADTDFDASSSDSDLRTNGAVQDWYESRETDPGLLTLNETSIGGNTTKKAAFAASTSGNTYLSQEFGMAQTGIFEVQWDIYMDEILDISAADRSGFMLIGDNSDATRTGPNSDDPERFVYLGFHAEGGASSGLMNLVARDRDDSWSDFTIVESGLSLDQWYTIKVICNVAGGTYDVYVDDVFSATVSSRHEKTSVSHISFAQWDDGAGSFFVDNVMDASVVTTYTLTMNSDPAEGGTTEPSSGEHEYEDGTVVTIEATAEAGYEFDNWTGDVDDPNLASTSITMDEDQTVTANYTQLPFITVSAPDGGENWYVGSAQNIVWTSHGTGGNVHIEYSTDNGAGWADITPSTPDNGTYIWTVPDEPSVTCLIRISDTDGDPSDESNAAFSISQVGTPVHFTPVWSGNGTDHMNFYAVSATLDGGDMQPGDEIGIFDGDYCVGAGILIEVLDGTNLLAIVASKNDAVSPEEPNGYTIDNASGYKIWNASEAREIDNVEIEYTTGDGIFAIGGSAAFNINGISSVDQTIPLLAGWNIFSLAVSPENVNMHDIVQTLVDEGTLEKVQDEAGNALEYVVPIGWVNNIGSWSSSEGYKIRVNSNTELVVSGNPISLPVSVDLIAGWNIFAFPELQSQEAMTVLSDLVDAGELLKVQDEAGNAIENVDPIGWIDNIESFDPGEGYKINVEGNCILTINESGSLKSTLNQKHEILKPSHFKPIGENNGIDHMNIYITRAEIGSVPLDPGDEIAVYDGENCVGACVISGDEIIVSVIAARDDPWTDIVDGFKKANTLSLRIWDDSEAVEISRIETYYLKGFSKIFEPMGTTALELKSLPGNDVLTSTNLGNNYPNPFINETTIDFSLGEESFVTIAIYNLLGEKIEILESRIFHAGNHSVTWNGDSSNGGVVSPGVYLYKMETADHRSTKMMSLIK